MVGNGGLSQGNSEEDSQARLMGWGEDSGFFLPLGEASLGPRSAGSNVVDLYWHHEWKSLSFWECLGVRDKEELTNSPRLWLKLKLTCFQPAAG